MPRVLGLRWRLRMHVPAGSRLQWCFLGLLFASAIWAGARASAALLPRHAIEPGGSVQGLIGVELEGIHASPPDWIADRRFLFVPGIQVQLQEVGTWKRGAAFHSSFTTDERGRYAFTA